MPIPNRATNRCVSLILRVATAWLSGLPTSMPSMTEESPGSEAGSRAGSASDPIGSPHIRVPEASAMPTCWMKRDVNAARPIATRSSKPQVT